MISKTQQCIMLMSLFVCMALARPKPNAKKPNAKKPKLPKQCETEDQQQGVRCQKACACDCTAPRKSMCKKVCKLPDGVQSVPWCDDGEDDNITQTTYTYMTAYGVDFKLDYITGGDTTEALPLAVIVHGGGFKNGARYGSNNKAWAQKFASRGFNVINIDYPLCKHYWDGTVEQLHTWDASAPVSDPDAGDTMCQKPRGAGIPDYVYASGVEIANHATRAAIQFAHSRAQDFNIDTTETVCIGGSAGAITCHDTALWNSTISVFSDANAGLIPDDAVNPFMPGYEQLDQFKINVALGFSGGTPTPKDFRNVTQQTIDAMAPGAALWNKHGRFDSTVPLSNAEVMMEAMESYNIPHELIVVESSEHGWNIPVEGQELDEMFEFITDNLANA